MKWSGCQRTWLQCGDADFCFGACQNKSSCSTSEKRLAEKKVEIHLAYLDPSVKADAMIVTRITNVSCALTGFVSYHTVRAYTCTK